MTFMIKRVGNVMTEKELHKEIRAMERQIHDPEILNQIYHHLNRELQKESDSYKPRISIGAFLLDRLLGEGGE